MRDASDARAPHAWLEVIVVTDETAAESVAEALRPFAEGESVVLEQLGDPHNLDPHAMLPQVHVKIYVPGERDTPPLRRRIADVLAAYTQVPPTFNLLAESDWANAWKTHYHPFRLGNRFWIQPSWTEAIEAEDDDIVLTLDPGMAFGTGLHPTTQMCLELLEERMRPGMTMLDVGTGSGILSIAAVKLGARRVLAIDTDPPAVEATRANAAMNGVADAVEVWEGTLTAVPVGAWDIVVVNILATVISGLLRDAKLLDYVQPEGVLILSGIVEQQQGEVEAVITAAAGRVVDVQRRGDWLALVVAAL